MATAAGDGGREGKGISQVDAAFHGVNPCWNATIRRKAHIARHGRTRAARCASYAAHMTPDDASPHRHLAAPPDPPAAAVTSEIEPALSMEGSGRGPGSFPVEVGFVLPDGASYCTLIRPPEHWTDWDAGAERAHRIARETAVAHGRDVAEVASQLNARLAGRLLYCDGVAEARSWLHRLFDATGMRPAFALEDLRVLLSAREAAFWHVVRQQVATERRLQRHRASADAKILQSALARLRGPLGAAR